MGRACVSETQGRAESVWRARRRVPGQVLEVRGATQLEAVKVKWCYADGSVGGGTMWVSPRQLPRVVRRMATARWEQRLRRAGVNVVRRGDADSVGTDPALMAAARRLGLQRAQRAVGGVRLYDDERRRPQLAKRLRAAGFDEMIFGAGGAACAGNDRTQGQVYGRIDDAELRQRHVE